MLNVSLIQKRQDTGCCSVRFLCNKATIGNLITLLLMSTSIVLYEVFKKGESLLLLSYFYTMHVLWFNINVHSASNYSCPTSSKIRTPFVRPHIFYLFRDPIIRTIDYIYSYLFSLVSGTGFTSSEYPAVC